MYSCASLGVKLGGGLGTAITGWLLAFSNYDKALAVQPESCINMLKLMYLVIPFVLDVQTSSGHQYFRKKRTN